MTTQIDTDVVIIGGGPVGLSAALDLSRRGIRSTVIELREYLEAPNVKCNHISSRTMERFRQFGIADKLRHAGLPFDYPHDVVFATSFTGEELSRISIPSPEARQNSSGTGPDTTWATPEPPHRINQRFMEPIIMEAANEAELVDVLYNTEFLSFEQDSEGVTATVLSKALGQEQRIRAKYLIGADGGRSLIRKAIGAKLEGDPVLQHVQSTHVRVPELYKISTVSPAWGYYTFNPGRRGHVYAINGKDEFLVHNHLSIEEYDASSVDRTQSIRDILGLPEGVDFEVINNEDWVARRLVSNSFRDRRVFIAGDAAHLWVPYAGYGMNAGIADGLNLTWLLAAVLQGWASEQILDAYEAERKPITEQVSKFVMNHQQRLASDDIPANLTEQGEAGAAARSSFGEYLYDLNVQQFAAEGLNYGYHYDRSPIIAYDTEEFPTYSMGSYTPSTVPGCRTPHFWLEDGSSLYDNFGKGYTLIALRDTDPMSEFIAEAQKAGLPVTVLQVDASAAPAEYEHGFVIARDDQHVVWRGNTLNMPAGDLVQLLAGNSARSLA